VTVVKKDLEACRRLPISDFSVGREAVLSFKLDRLEEQVDMYWRQHAHVNWLQKGVEYNFFPSLLFGEKKGE
jgi:hypothetical protein